MPTRRDRTPAERTPGERAQPERSQPESPAPKGRPGAPRKPDDKRADESVKIRLTAALKAQMAEQADSEGLVLGAWLRSVAIKAMKAAKR